MYRTADPTKNPEFSICHSYDDVKYGFWINPSTSKGYGFKKPADF